MANPNPSNSTRFRPGVSGNPSGRPPLPPELRNIAILTADEVRRMIARYARMTRMEVAAAIDAPTTSLLEVSVATMFFKSAESGDFARLAFLLDRTIGRSLASDPTDTEEAADRAAFEAMPMDELLKLVKEHLPEIEASIA